VGIGQYHYLDFHPNEAPGHVDLGTDGNRSLPFSIPLGALIPLRTDGLILSAKSIGTTHITNSAYRMHPIEWAIGEAGGHLAAFTLDRGVRVRDVAKDRQLQRLFQGQLARFGIPLFWFNDVSHDDPDFEAIQVLAAAGLVRTENSGNLNFNPEATVSRAVAAIALVNILGLEPTNPTEPTFADVPADYFACASIEALFARGIVKGVGRKRFAPDRSITREQLAILTSKIPHGAGDNLSADLPKDRQPIRRRELSRVLYRLLNAKLGRS
jgi:FAD dependent oxidoreductase/S-layer homology domain